MFGPVGTRNGLSRTETPPTVLVEVVAWKAAPGRSAVLTSATGLRWGAVGRSTGFAAPLRPLASRTGLPPPVLMASPIRFQRATFSEESFQLATSAW